MTSDKTPYFKSHANEKTTERTQPGKGQHQFDRRAATSVWTQQVALKSFPGHIELEERKHQGIEEINISSTENISLLSSTRVSSLVHHIYFSIDRAAPKALRWPLLWIGNDAVSFQTPLRGKESGFNPTDDPPNTFSGKNTVAKVCLRFPTFDSSRFCWR